MNKASKKKPGVISRWLGLDPASDLIGAILLDHDDLKKLIRVLKDAKQPIRKRQVAFGRFRSLLLSHSDSEERALYAVSRHIKGVELKTEEGSVEHRVAKDLLRKIKPHAFNAKSRHWTAQLQVLGELVEHHLKEEERDLLPVVRKNIDPETEASHCRMFLRLRARSQKVVDKENAGALVVKRSPV